jgi:hypothetical protein
MGRLVEADLGAVGKRDGRQATPRLLCDRSGQPDTLRLECRDRHVEVVAQQVDLAPRGLGGVDGEFGGRQGEDKLALTGIHEREAQGVPEEGTGRVGRRAEEDGVDPDDHAALILAGDRVPGITALRSGCIRSERCAHLGGRGALSATGRRAHRL